MYTWDAPHYGYAITGGTLVDSGANWVTITAEGEVTLTGKKYIHTTRTLAKANPQALAAERGNVVRVEQATLLTVENAAAALERLYAFYLLRQTLTEEIVVNGQQLSLIHIYARKGCRMRAYTLSQMEGYPGLGRGFQSSHGVYQSGRTHA